MEAGASAKSDEGIAQIIDHGLRAERVDLRVGYASLAINVGIDHSRITRMHRVGELGANHGSIQALWCLARRVACCEFTAEHTRLELAGLGKDTPRHSAWLTALATGMACAAFGRLLGADWNGASAVFLAATVGQFVALPAHRAPRPPITQLKKETIAAERKPFT
jgi:uncharacterized membrane protein YjjP (DUF1212 family)